MATPTCPERETLERALLGMLPEAQADQLEQHFSTCQRCLATMEEIGGVDTLVEAMRAGPAAAAEMAQYSDQVKKLIERWKSPSAASVEVTPAASAADEPTADLGTLRPAGSHNDDEIDFLAPAQAADELGRLGIYRVLRVLGTGGMGVVFEAEDPQLKRRVAIKAMKPSVAASASSRRRFLREAQIAASVEHDHIVPIYQVADDRGIPFIAMPLLRGETLADRLAKVAHSLRGGESSSPSAAPIDPLPSAGAALPTAEILRIGREIALGLDAAHQVGLVHRDIKPGNIWLEGTTGRVKILDFGLARAASTEEQITHAGTVLGTPSYMAPEQGRGEEIDARADLFSLGCVLYHCATGTRPFTGGDPLSTLLAVMSHNPPPPRELNPTLPEELSAVIVSLLLKDPAGRPQTAREVADRLQAVAQASSLVSSSAGSAELDSVATLPRFNLPSSNPLPALEPLVDARGARLQRHRWLAAVAAAAAAAALVLGIVIIIKNEKGKVVAEIRSDQPVTVKPADGHTVEVSNDATEQPRVDSPPAETTHEVGMSYRWPADAPAPAIAPFDAAEAEKLQQAWADYLKLPLEYTNSIGMKLVLIPAGEYLMGSTDEQIEAALKVAEAITMDQRSKDIVEKGQRPQHKVVISKPFLMSATEVTVGQFRKFVEATKYVTEAEYYGFGDSMFTTVNEKITDAQKQKSWRTPGYELSDDLPVTQITWNDAVACCRWLSTREKATYRLPTEAEWEYACRAGTTTQFSFGDDYTQLDRYGWFAWNSSGGGPHAVGTKLPNAFLFDTHGNLWEWCSDFFDERWFEKSPSIDPKGPSLGSVRVVRGGSWAIDAPICGSATRYYGPPSFRNSYVGFRCVQALDVPSTVVATVKKNAEAEPQKAETKTAKQDLRPKISSSNAESTIQNPQSDWHGWPTDAPAPAIAPFNAAQAKKHQQKWADYLNLPLEHTNSVGMKFILIPPGEFTMGGTPDDIEAALKEAKEVSPNNKLWQELVKSEEPQHKVILTQPFYFAVHEVTQKEYEAVVGSNPSYFAKTGPEPKLVELVTEFDTANFPVEGVSWNGAAEFCATLSKQEELKPFYFRAGENVTALKGNGYRLPTEAEWEFACRAGTTSEFWNGDGLPAGWCGRNAGRRTHEVEQLGANPFGLFDVHGNVSEWVQDGWDPTYYAKFADKAAVNPSCSFSGDAQRGGDWGAWRTLIGTGTALRGGDWGNGVSLCRSARRQATDAAHYDSAIGFRVVLETESVRAEASTAKSQPQAPQPQD